VVAVSNYVFHWPAWVSFRLLPALILAGFIVSFVSEAARSARERAGQG